ncbi:DeoR/GlpR family DNA-binding transcription regulator [Siphonobacter sp. SORGH_AS_1065]|uniref:DeoR/GlpR family DNA-binding transcription regulator n=1 Tax=Siphonobacter sp. SORGH_AS_1065 TaxID=3041795 RepID=UPI00277D4DF4|nr:DeoR/GlpR family DNA-binding transcription regulator [Siphonobacter sp. SORGH_AS_1065]MDQ1089917.1 DeoR/GlpR family transcriptional regulator of sugar metabolism [Siphonobacter sp. SORGH_AS_1065]
MLKEERFDHILKELKSSNKVFFEGLAKDLQVSEDTIRRDIELLSKSGLLVKVRGGAINPSVNPLSFQDRTDLFSDAKKVIALKAQQLLKSVRTVFMDGGTTTLAVAASLPVQSELRVITNNMALIPMLSNHEHVEIIVLGGMYNRLTKTNLGVQTALEAQKYQADLYLMGTCAIDSDRGITAAIHEDGEIKKIYMKAAVKTAVLANHEKLGTVDFFNVAELSSIDTLITDLPSNDARLNPYRSFDLEIL